jgi:hypothetical protein
LLVADREPDEREVGVVAIECFLVELQTLIDHLFHPTSAMRLCGPLVCRKIDDEIAGLATWLPPSA